MLRADKKGAAFAAPAKFRAAISLLRHARQVIDRSLDVGIAERLIAAFGRHRTFAFERARIERLDAGFQARRPCGFVTGLWRACYTGAMTYDASRFVNR